MGYRALLRTEELLDAAEVGRLRPRVGVGGGLSGGHCRRLLHAYSDPAATAVPRSTPTGSEAAHAIPFWRGPAGPARPGPRFGAGVAAVGGAASQQHDPPRPDLLLGTLAGSPLRRRLVGALVCIRTQARARERAHTHTRTPTRFAGGPPRALPGPGFAGVAQYEAAAARRPNAVGARRRAGAPSPSGAPPGPRLAPSHASSGPIPCRLGGGAGGHAAAGFPHPLPVAGRLGGLVARTLSEVQHVPRGRLPARRRGLRGRGRLAPGGGLARLSLGLARADRRLLRPRYGATVRVY